MERRSLSGNMCNDVLSSSGILEYGDLSPKHVGRFKIMMYNLQFYCLHVLYINNYKHDAWNE
jgi:hypothetical protein